MFCSVFLVKMLCFCSVILTKVALEKLFFVCFWLCFHYWGHCYTVVYCQLSSTLVTTIGTILPCTVKCPVVTMKGTTRFFLHFPKQGNNFYLHQVNLAFPVSDCLILSNALTRGQWVAFDCYDCFKTFQCLFSGIAPLV